MRPDQHFWAFTGLLRTYLAPGGYGKAPIADPRRAMGLLLGHAVRFGEPDDVLAAGEGIETVLSLLSLFPSLPMAAGLSAAHLAAILFPASLRRLYILRDNDAAGAFAAERLGARCRAAGIGCRVLKPATKDLNADLQRWQASAVKGRLIAQLAAAGSAAASAWASAVSISSSLSSSCSSSRLTRSEEAPKDIRFRRAIWVFSFSASSVFSRRPALAASRSAVRSATSRLSSSISLGRPAASAMKQNYLLRRLGAITQQAAV